MNHFIQLQLRKSQAQSLIESGMCTAITTHKPAAAAATEFTRILTK